ncbi:hypothetical protein [Kerstersia gyiorum]|uniref:Uncharacterized protein n=1 Tax=Kerstersia gyiorum TaxID=206506 RepID=A0A171KSI5_9BURK|nr:hypothetical protein [Kerstersia gyiorum]KKO71852.1 hypothetical protein AAV32_09800 [Kerstersia gyiorum]
MAIDIPYRVTTSGGDWTTVASGVASATVALFNLAATNATAAGATIGLRLRKSAGTAVIVPADLLPAEAGDNATRLRIPLLPLEPGDVLEAYSDQGVMWAGLGRQLATLSPYSRVASVSGDTWTTITNLAGPVGALWFANTAMGSAFVSARIVAGSTLIRTLFDGEEIEEGGSRRMMDPDVLSSGQSLQIKSVGGIDAIATGVRA